jgi:HAD superfamily hydrolase (TIGR01450 family)
VDRPLSAIAHRYGALVVDLDGCVWIGDEITPGTPEALAAWRESGREVVFVTNEARLAPEDHVRKLWRLGVRASAGGVITVGTAVQRHLADGPPGRTAAVVGSRAMANHVALGGCKVVNGTRAAAHAQVVVLSAHDLLTYAELRDALQAACAGAELLAAGRDATFPMPDGPWPGSGCVVAAVEYASGRAAVNVGKPAAGIFAAAVARLQSGPALVVGDRLDADVGGAAAAGLDAALVLSGVATSEAAGAWTGAAPVAVAPTLADLLLG